MRFVGGVSIVLLALAASMTARADQLAADCGRGWVYFDLGNTLVDTADFDHLHYLPGAAAYLRKLKDAGFHIGLITNIPESWGTTEAEKIASLKADIARGWSDSQSFDWEIFDQLLVSMFDSERKPGATLFKRALQRSEGCKVAYEGEDHREVEAAGLAGFNESYLVGKDPDAYYAPLDGLLSGALRR
jgi:hypothetical protein